MVSMSNYSMTLKQFVIPSAKAEGGRAWYDNSDAMIDYFDTAFYVSINVGSGTSLRS